MYNDSHNHDFETRPQAPQAQQTQPILNAYPVADGQYKVRIDSALALETLVRADGNLHRAAEQLGSTPQELLAAIVVDQNNSDMLDNYLRAYTKIRMFTMLAELQDVVVIRLQEDSVAAKDLAKAFTSIAEILTKLTEHTAQPITNPFEVIRKTLPPHVRQAIDDLVGGTSGESDAFVA